MNNNLTKLFLAVVVLISSNLAFSADYNIPSLSRCLNDMQAANSNDSKVYNIYSDFYYEYSDKRDYAAAAVNKMAKQFSAETSACRQFSQPMNRETITCEKFAGSDVCIVPSDAGEFIVVKDYVDSTNIILTEYANDYTQFPRVKAVNDSQLLWMPKPEICYDGLLSGLWDGQAHSLDAKDYTRFGDLRYVMARTSRDLVKQISLTDASCQYQTLDHLASDTQCLNRSNKPSICGLPTTGGGYFVFVTDKDNQVHLVFNRWD